MRVGMEAENSRLTEPTRIIPRLKEFKILVNQSTLDYF